MHHCHCDREYFHRSRRRSAIAVVLLGLALSACADSMQSPSLQEVDAVFASYDAPGSVGCALGVAQNGEFLYRKGYGYANLDWDIPITPATVFYVGSVSKQFTAATIALLAQNGLLSLDDNIRQYLPEMPDYDPPVTIRHVLHHTSGIRNMWKIMEENGLTTWNRFSRDEALTLLSRQELDFPPGERYQYSNGGYFALAMIVERASGKTLAEYAQENIFEPLGMHDTHFHDDPVQIVKRRAMSYMPRKGGDETYYQSYKGNFALPGPGGLYTTVNDLLLWDRNFLNNKLSGPEFLEVMHTKGVLNDGEVLDYALAIKEGQHRGLKILYHTGSYMGFKAYYVRYPDVRFSTWVLCNMGEIVPAELGSQVAELYLSDLMDPPE